MANVTITIPDAIVARLTVAARSTFPQYAALTPVQLFQTETANHWKEILASAEMATAQAAANATCQATYNKAIADSIGIS